MKLSSPTLFVEINNENFIFLAFDISENNKFELLEDINGGSEIKDLMLSY